MSPKSGSCWRLWLSGSGISTLYNPELYKVVDSIEHFALEATQRESPGSFTALSDSYAYTACNNRH